MQFSMSDDFFKSYELLISKANMFFLTKKYLFVAKIGDQEKTDIDLMISAANVPKYKFKMADMPMKHLYEHSFTILDTEEG